VSSILVACSSKVEALQTLDAKEITSLGNNCKTFFTSFIDASNTKDIEKILPFFADDIIAYDPFPMWVGIDGIIAMFKYTFDLAPNLQQAPKATYISKDECFTSDFALGVFGFTQDYPGIDYGLFFMKDGKISSWRQMYDPHFLGVIERGDIDYDFLSQFVSSWSGGDINKIMKIYSNDAKLEDNLFGVSVSGKGAIRDYANSFFAKNPGASWEMLEPFAESVARSDYREQYPYPSQGGVYAITVKDSGGNPCEIRAVVILTPNEEGKIQSQKVFYNADALLACGWAK
jgi:ketosteroid isomerase-like protein